MKIGGKYQLAGIGARAWEKLARELHLDFGALRDRILHLAGAMPEAATRVGDEIKTRGIAHDVIGRLVAALRQRALDCKIAMEK